MKILLASDHRGYELKNVLISHLEELGYDIEDKGPSAYDEHDDYPLYIAPAAKEVSIDPVTTKAIILGASGQGEAIVANRFRGVRAVVYYGGNEEIISLSREHNNANILSLGASFISEEDAKRVVVKWLETEFTNEERHVRRIEQIDLI